MESLYQTVLQLINETLGESGKKFTVGAFSGIGWLEFPYESSTYKGNYPRVALKKYEKTVNVYIMEWSSELPLIQKYESVFGRSNLGQGCIRLRNLTLEKETALRELLVFLKQQYSEQ